MGGACPVPIGIAAYIGDVRRLPAIASLALLGALVAGCGTPGPAARSTGTTTSPTAVSPTSASTTTPAPASSETLERVALFNPTTGYGVFTIQRGDQCQDAVGETTDGGARFSVPVEVTSWGCASASTVSTLAFDDHGDGFLYGPQLFVTHDAGTIWGAVPVSGSVLSVEALGYSVWLVESVCPSGMATPSGCPLRLLQSSDGGRSWAAASVPAAAAVNPGAGGEMVQGQTTLVRLGVDSAYLLTNPSGPNGTTNDVAPLWFTADGGRSWSARQIPCAMSAMSVVLSAAPDGTLLAVCAGEPGAGSQEKSAVRSTNGGVTWTTELSCPVPGGGVLPATCGSPEPDFGYLGSLDAVTGDQAYMVGGRSSLLVTEDAGAQWLVVQPPIGGTDDGTWQVIFFSDLDGVVLGVDGNNDEATTIWHTTDGGITWRSVVPVAA
jgi:photosystem II stability/assembly factor-like uncharacterized protein